jgi:hypothetical protein
MASILPQPPARQHLLRASFRHPQLDTVVLEQRRHQPGGQHQHLLPLAGLGTLVVTSAMNMIRLHLHASVNPTGLSTSTRSPSPRSC